MAAVWEACGGRPWGSYSLCVVVIEGFEFLRELWFVVCEEGVRGL